MGKEKNSEEVVEEPSLQLQLLLGAGIGIITIVGMCLTIFVGENFLKWKPGAMSLIAGFRIILILSYPLCFLPGAVLMELFYITWKRRPFRPLNILIASALLAEGLLFAVIASGVFELLFPGLELVDQVPILGVSAGIAILATVATGRISRVRSFLRKAFD